MTWYKIAQTTIDDFADRNIVNEKIDKLKGIADSLVTMSKMVFQSGTVTRGMLRGVAEQKVLSSYPVIVEMIRAADSVCLDSPHKFADLVKVAAAEVAMRVRRLEKDRKEFVNKTLVNRLKGWRENG